MLKTENKIECVYCKKKIFPHNVERHSDVCYLNPSNIKYCLVCKKPIKNIKNSKGTCSRGCANTHFRSGINHGNWKAEYYRSTCFFYHKKECVICKENNIVEVHHLDHDRLNNVPENLVPLCPTHHQYWHSKHKNLIEDAVIRYIKEWIANSDT